VIFVIKALVVDDEKLIRECLARTLRTEDVEVKTAASGEIAVELAKAESFDIVFLDMVMPGIDGGKTYAALKKIQNNARYVIVSGSPIGSFLETAKKDGIPIIRKPFDTDEIMAEVERLRQVKTAGI
jgi:DNA-binding NtrC family response regulator